MNPAPFNQAVFPISLFRLIISLFLPALHSFFPPCNDFRSVLSDAEEDLQPLTPSGLDLPTNSVVTFLCRIYSPSKIPSNPASPDETAAPPLRSTNNPTNVIPDAASSPSTGLQLSFSLPENDQSKTLEELPPFFYFYWTFDYFFHAPINSNFGLTTLLLTSTSPWLLY